jgi:hypothetical protein
MSVPASLIKGQVESNTESQDSSSFDDPEHFQQEMTRILESLLEEEGLFTRGILPRQQPVKAK